MAEDLNVYKARKGSISSSGSKNLPWAALSGALVNMPWVQALVNEGRVFVVNFGTDTTPVALEAAYDADQPDLNLDVPNGTKVMPLYFEVAVEATGAANFECHVMASPTAVGAGTSTALVPQNMLLAGPASGCAARRTYTGNGTDPSTNARWFMNVFIGQDLDGVAITPVFRWSALESPAPIVRGGGSINAYIYNPTSGTAFATLIYAEWTDDEL